LLLCDLLNVLIAALGCIVLLLSTIFQH